MGASVVPLATFKITIRCGRAVLTRTHTVWIHAQTHRTARRPPRKSRVNKCLCKPFCFGLSFNETRPWHDDGFCHIAGQAPAFNNRGRLTKVLNPSIGTGADEDPV